MADGGRRPDGLSLDGVDLEMAAVDVAEALSKYHELDVCEDDILPVLKPFLETVLANARASGD